MYTDNNSNKLFIVCPFCQVEHLVRRQFGDVFFCTAPATYFNLDEVFTSSIRHLVMREHIDEIYLIGDLGCALMKASMDEIKGFPILQEIQQIKSGTDDLSTWSEKIVQDQMQKLATLDLIKDRLSNGQLSLHAMRLDQNSNQFIEYKTDKKWDSGLLSAT